VELPPAKDIKPGTRFSVKTVNGFVEVRVLKFNRGKAKSNYVATCDGETKKQVVIDTPASVFFQGSEFTGAFSMAIPLENGQWAVRADFMINNDVFWEGVSEPSAPLSGDTPPPERSSGSYFFS
jgi:hypothetical protein